MSVVSYQSGKTLSWPTDYVNRIICGDCLTVMKGIPDGAVDLVVTDPPYGTTGNKWDMVVPFDLLWSVLNRVANGKVIATSSQPFTTDLIVSNRNNFKYLWVWNKGLAGNGILAKKQPLKVHEDICVFGDMEYQPQMRRGMARFKGGIKDKHGTFGGAESPTVFNDNYYPVSIINCSGAGLRSTRTHPTEKPVQLFSYLLKTYSTSNDIILDPFAGSGTTCVAAKQLGRKFIGIEINPDYCKIAEDRLRQEELF